MLPPRVAPPSKRKAAVAPPGARKPATSCAAARTRSLRKFSPSETSSTISPIFPAPFGFAPWHVPASAMVQDCHDNQSHHDVADPSKEFIDRASARLLRCYLDPGDLATALATITCIVGIFGSAFGAVDHDGVSSSNAVDRARCDQMVQTHAPSLNAGSAADRAYSSRQRVFDSVRARIREPSVRCLRVHTVQSQAARLPQQRAWATPAASDLPGSH